MTNMTKKHNTLGGKIQRCRKSLGISQEELAQRLGVSRQSVAKWETGQSVPDLNRLVTLADMLGASLDYLLRDAIPQDAVATAEVAPVVQPPAETVAAACGTQGDGGVSDVAASAGMSSPGREHVCPPFDRQEEILPSVPESEPCMEAAAADAGEQRESGSTVVWSATMPRQAVTGSTSRGRGGAGRVQADCSREPFGFSTRRLVAACGMALVTVGIAGLATRWVRSEMYPVQLAMWDGSVREGVWGFVLAHNLDNVFFATCGTVLGGVVLLGGVWISSRRRAH